MDTEPATPPLPSEQEKCLHCKVPVSPNRPTSFCSADCERQYVKRNILKPRKPVRRRRR